MKKVLIAYFSKTGTTETMAEYIAEGVRIAGHAVELKKVSDVKTEKDLTGYDAYIFGCPTYFLDMPEPFKRFLSVAEKVDLNGKIGGAFSSRAHPSSGEGIGAARSLFETMESRLKMRMTNLGPFDLQGGLTEKEQDMHTCQDYGKAVAEMLGAV
jgi:flavodoxin